MRYITTIADKCAEKGLSDLVASLRHQGWDKPVYVFCPDDSVPDVPDGCQVVECNPWWRGIETAPNGAALLKPAIFGYSDFLNGDQVAYFDASDTVLLCDPNEVFGYAGDAGWCAHRCRLAKPCCIPIDKAVDLELDVKYTGGKKTVNTGVIISTISNTVREDAQKWLMIEKSILADAEWRPTHPPGDQETFDYIFRASRDTKQLPDVFNYRGFSAVTKLEIQNGELYKRTGARVFIPHASGPGSLPNRILALSKGLHVRSIAREGKAISKSRVGPSVDIDSTTTSVIMPAYKSDWCLGRALDSIARQSILPTEVLVGIDACEDTRDAAKDAVPEAIADRTQVFYFPEHVGCYVIRNTLAEKATGDVLLFFDADDEMLPYYNVAGLSMLRKNVIVSPASCWMSEGEVIRKKHTPHGAFFIHRDEFMVLNGFEPWVCSADSEFQDRAKGYGIKRVNPDIVTFIRHKHDQNLTVRPDTNATSAIRREINVIIQERRKASYVKTDFESCECERLI